MRPRPDLPAWPGEQEARVNTVHHATRQVRQAAQRERRSVVVGIDYLAERVGWHIATVVVKGQLMEEQLPFVFVRELSGRERLPATGERRGGAVQVG